MTNKAKTRQQIAAEFGISTKTLKKWMDAEGIILQRGLISPYQQNIIYQKFGIPNIPYFSKIFQIIPILIFVIL
jgi:hypothetical protein